MFIYMFNVEFVTIVDLRHPTSPFDPIDLDKQTPCKAVERNLEVAAVVLVSNIGLGCWNLNSSTRVFNLRELEAENAAYLSEVLRLSKLTQRRATVATERNLSASDGLWDSDSDLPAGSSSGSRPSSRPASAASRRHARRDGGPGEAFKHAASVYLVSSHLPGRWVWSGTQVYEYSGSVYNHNWVVP